MNSFLRKMLKVSMWATAVLGLLVLVAGLALWICPKIILRAAALIGVLFGLLLLSSAVWILFKAKTP